MLFVYSGYRKCLLKRPGSSCMFYVLILVWLINKLKWNEMKWNMCTSYCFSHQQCIVQFWWHRHLRLSRSVRSRKQMVSNQQLEWVITIYLYLFYMLSAVLVITLAACTKDCQFVSVTGRRRLRSSDIDTFLLGWLELNCRTGKWRTGKCRITPIRSHITLHRIYSANSLSIDVN